MNFQGLDWRQRRNILNHTTAHYPIANYSTDSMKKPDMKFDETLLSKIHSIPDPLKKNLADTVVHSPEKIEETANMSVFIGNYMDTEKIPWPECQPSQSGNFTRTFSSITNFVTSVFGAISGAVFTKRPKSPDIEYFDCSDSGFCTEMPAPCSWQSPKIDELNKTLAADSSEANDNMSNSRAAVAQCESKLNVVRNLLSSEPQSKSISNPRSSRLWFRRPKRVFVEPSSVHDSYVDEYATDEYVSLANEEYIEYFGVRNNITSDRCEVDAPKMKTDTAPTTDIIEVVIKPEFPDEISNLKNVEGTEIVEVVPEINVSEIQSDCNCSDKVIPIETNANSVETKESNEVVNPVTEKEVNKEIISSCEDKMARLKSLLQSKRKPLRSVNKANHTEPLEHKTSTDNISTKVPVELAKNKTQKPSDPSEHKTSTSHNIPTKMPLEISKEIVTKKPPIPIPIQKPKDKRFKNPHRRTEKRKHTKLRKNIQEDMQFANEIDSNDIENKVHIDSSGENSPVARISDSEIPSSVENDHFDEVKGRFHSSSLTDSDDSFQIVFSEIPKTRLRKSSDCDSEDSFIVFEDSPDSCYTSNDVFGDSETESSDSETEMSDSGCDDVCKLSNSLSRTVSDLTDDSLYVDKGDDEIDCAVRTFEEIPSVEEEDYGEKLRGVLIDDSKKIKRKELPPKKVRFSEKPPKVHVMRVWAFAARQARAGHWERLVLDRDRFKRRIADVDMAVSWVLKPQHRSRVMFQRFMPWWNAQRRKEIAEKKEAEKRKKEEEEKLLEEQKMQEKILEEHKAQENLLEEQNIQENIVEEQKMQDKVLEEQKTQEKVLEEQIMQDGLIKDQTFQDNVTEEINLEHKTIDVQKVQDMATAELKLQDKVIENKKLQNELIPKQKLQDKPIKNQILEDKVISEKKLQDKPMQNQKLQDFCLLKRQNGQTLSEDIKQNIHLYQKGQQNKDKQNFGDNKAKVQKPLDNIQKDVGQKSNEKNIVLETGVQNKIDSKVNQNGGIDVDKCKNIPKQLEIKKELIGNTENEIKSNGNNSNMNGNILVNNLIVNR